MLHIDLICVGGLRQRFVFDFCQQYVKWLQPFCRLNVVELKKQKFSSNLGESRVVEQEGRAILERLKADSFKVALCVEGEMVSSKWFAEKILKVQNCGFSRISFIIGGAYGLFDGIKKISNFKLSLSKMTLPHQIARVVLLEQIYRAFTILNGMNYDK